MEREGLTKKVDKYFEDVSNNRSESLKKPSNYDAVRHSFRYPKISRSSSVVRYEYIQFSCQLVDKVSDNIIYI